MTSSASRVTKKKPAARRSSRAKSQAKPRSSARLPATDYVTINSVLEQDLGLAWTKKNQIAIKRRVGSADFLKIMEIISFTSNQEAWLKASTLSAAGDSVAGKLSQHYPALSPAAIFKLVNQATYGWR